MDFQIMEQVAGKQFIPALDKKTKLPLIFPCPKQAAKAAAELTETTGGKFQPRPVAEPDDIWRDRERLRFANGAYKLVIWDGMNWWDKNHNPNHFAHVSVKDPTRIAFTKDSRDGTKDIQTSMKPGKYLTEFFAKVLTADQIRTYAMQHSMKFENKELKFVTTPEEIQRVYKPRLGCSCFSDTTKANLYGSGDFAVAYIEDKTGAITARAVCAPERKIFARTYGDDYRLRKLLNEAGYTASSFRSDWQGLRLLKKWYWRGFYLDCGGYPEPNLTDEEYFVI